MTARINTKLKFEDIKEKLPIHQRSWKKSVVETYRDASINTNWNSALKKTCTENNVAFMTSPYDLNLARDVAPLLDTFKIGSGDISWLEIVDELCSTGKNIIVATGASDFDDVKRIYKKNSPSNKRLYIDLYLKTIYLRDKV